LTMDKWNPCNLQMAYQVSGVTFAPGSAFPYPLDALPLSIQQTMPGLKEAFVSGYLDPQEIRKTSFSGLGEVAVVREYADIVKSYLFVFGWDLDGSMHYTGPFKGFSAHYTSGIAPIVLDDIFGNTPHSP